MNEQDQFEYEIWCAYQELTMDDVCNCIQDSPAILRAIHNNNFKDVAELVKHRVDRSVKRLAEYRMYGNYKSPETDPEKEMLDYKKLISDRINNRIDQFRSFQ